MQASPSAYLTSSKDSRERTRSRLSVEQNHQTRIPCEIRVHEGPDQQRCHGGNQQEPSTLTEAITPADRRARPHRANLSHVPIRHVGDRAGSGVCLILSSAPEIPLIRLSKDPNQPKSTRPVSCRSLRAFVPLLHTTKGLRLSCCCCVRAFGFADFVEKFGSVSSPHRVRDSGVETRTTK